MKSLFSDIGTAAKAVPLLANCGECGLYKQCESPKMEPTGQGKRQILIVGEAPGEKEDQKGVQFIGKSGQWLRRVLQKAGVDLDRDCWKTNTLICRPPANATPTNRQIEYCRPNVARAIRELEPQVIICLGGSAVRSVLAGMVREIGPIGRWVGWKIPCRQHNAWICPTYHPAYALRAQDPVVDRIIESDLRAATSLTERPWKEIPDYRRDIEIIMEPDKAAEAVRRMIGRGSPIAFDYETNRLKPDRSNARIISCSICWAGEYTIAYAWHGEVIRATRELLRSPCAKIASNMKFEERWTRAILKTSVRNWRWDTMLAAHVLDNRRGISGLKFQSFVRLGAESYDDHIQQYLSSSRPDGTNRIDEIDLEELLVYNAMDSLLEYRVAVKQMEEME